MTGALAPQQPRGVGWGRPPPGGGAHGEAGLDGWPHWGLWPPGRGAACGELGFIICSDPQ